MPRALWRQRRPGAACEACGKAKGLFCGFSSDRGVPFGGRAACGSVEKIQLTQVHRALLPRGTRAFPASRRPRAEITKLAVAHQEI